MSHTHYLPLCIIALFLNFGCPNLRITFEIAVFEPKEENKLKTPIPGVKVQLKQADGNYSSEVYTDNDGLATLELPVDDSEQHDYLLTASKCGYETTVITVDGQVGFEVPKEIFLPKISQ